MRPTHGVEHVYNWVHVNPNTDKFQKNAYLLGPNKDA